MNKEILELRFSHLGEIGFRLAIFSLVFAIVLLLSSFLSFFIFAVVAIIGFFLPFITLGFIFVANPHYFSDLSKLLDNSSAIFDFFAKVVNYGKYVVIAGIIGSIIGAIFLLSNKNDRHWGKFTFCIISIVLCVILFVLIVSGAFNQGFNV